MWRQIQNFDFERNNVFSGLKHLVIHNCDYLNLELAFCSLKMTFISLPTAKTQMTPVNTPNVLPKRYIWLK